LIEEAALYRKIIQGERFYANYFRVVYHGSGFSEDIREKEFVYRGVKLEPVMDFVGRIKKKYTDAFILMSSDKPSEKQREQNPKIISVTTLVRPSYVERCQLLSVWEHKDNKQMKLWQERLKEFQISKSSPSTHVSKPQQIPEQVRKQRENSDIQVFNYSVPVQKGGKNPKNEFKDLWVVKTSILVKEPFPSNRRRIQVVDRKESHVSPVENATETIIEKTKELQQKIANVAGASFDQPVDLNPLSMGLNGVIDAAVSGGAQMYIEAFLYDSFLKDNPGQEKQQEALKQALREQITLLKTGLKTFGDRAGESLVGLHDHLRKNYLMMLDKTKDVLT